MEEYKMKTFEERRIENQKYKNNKTKQTEAG